MKKTALCLVFVMMICVFAAGCSKKKNELIGMEKIEELRSAAAKYESARYFIINVGTGELEQVFTFMYDGDRQVYLYESTQGENYTAEYSDGKGLYREENGVGTAVSEKDSSFAVYTRKKPHSYSSGELFFYINEYVTSSREAEDDDGNTVYVYDYDMAKINKSLSTNLTEFVTSYAFDKDGKFVYFRQYNAFGSGEGENFTYEIKVSEINRIKEIENPIDVKGN